ncbi:MAG TPA: hypothetical protein VL523_02435, partial [Terriglobia bacterium]|nr:hypothetical protein [Terriglobia bacterium]
MKRLGRKIRPITLIRAGVAAGVMLLLGAGATSAFGQTCMNSIDDAWVGSSSGVWSIASNWSAGEPSSTCDVFIQSGAAVTLDVNGSTANLTIGSGNSLTLPTVTNASPNLNVGGSSITNNGQIIMAVPVTFGTTGITISATGTVTLSGGGTITLNANSNGGDYLGSSGGATTLLNQSTIEGGGGFDMTFDNASTGLIDANEPGEQLVVGRNNTNGPSTNTGLMEATAGGQLAMGSLTLNNVGGTISASGTNSYVQLEGEGQGGETFTGGTWTTSSGGVIQVVDTTATLDATNGNTITNSGTMQLVDGAPHPGGNFQGTINNTGTIQIESRGSDITLNIPANQTLTLTGPGNVTMGDGTSNSYNNHDFISGGNGPTTLVNESTIQGTGLIENGIAVTNSGTINANVPTGANNLQLWLTRLESPGLTNTGTLEATNGGVLILGAVTLTNTGGTVSASGTGSYVNTYGSSVTGGSFSTSAGGTIYTNQNGGNISTITGITNIGAIVISDTQTAAFSGTVTNTGTITVDSSGNSTTLAIPVGQTLTLSGSGKVIMTNFAQNAIQASSCGSATLINSSTIEGSGTFFTNTNCSGVMTNSGTLLANQTVPLIILAATFTNTGTLSVAAGSTMDFQGGASRFTNLVNGTLTGGKYSVTGTLQIPGNITTNNAGITLTGTTSQILNPNTNALTGFLTNGAKGSFTLAGNQIFTTTGSFNNAGGVKISKGSTFTVGAGGSFNQAGGKLTVDGVLAFSTTANFASGDAFYPAAGSVNIQKGSVFGNGGMLGANVKSSGSVTPGDLATTPGVLGVSGAYTQTSAGSLNADISGTIAGSQYGQLRVSS